MRFWGSFMFKPSAAAAACILSLFAVGNAHADGWFSGDWYLKLGGAGFTAPKYQGDNKNEFGFSPIISLGRQGQGARPGTTAPPSRFWITVRSAWVSPAA